MGREFEYANKCGEAQQVRSLWALDLNAIILSNIVCNQFFLDSTTNLPHSRTVTVASATPNAYAVIKTLPESLR